MYLRNIQSCFRLLIVPGVYASNVKNIKVYIIRYVWRAGNYNSSTKTVSIPLYVFFYLGFKFNQNPNLWTARTDSVNEFEPELKPVLSKPVELE